MLHGSGASSPSSREMFQREKLLRLFISRATSRLRRFIMISSNPRPCILCAVLPDFPKRAPFWRCNSQVSGDFGNFHRISNIGAFIQRVTRAVSESHAHSVVYGRAIRGLYWLLEETARSSAPRREAWRRCGRGDGNQQKRNRRKLSSSRLFSCRQEESQLCSSAVLLARIEAQRY